MSPFGAIGGSVGSTRFDSEWSIEDNRTWFGSAILGQLPGGVLRDAPVMGIADGFAPGIIERNAALIDEFIAVSGEDTLTEMRRLARDHGLLVVPSSSTW